MTSLSRLPCIVHSPRKHATFRPEPRHTSQRGAGHTALPRPGASSAHHLQYWCHDLRPFLAITLGCRLMMHKVYMAIGLVSCITLAFCQIQGICLLHLIKHMHFNTTSTVSRALLQAPNMNKATSARLQNHIIHAEHINTKRHTSP